MFRSTIEIWRGAQIKGIIGRNGSSLEKLYSRLRRNGMGYMSDALDSVRIASVY